MSGTIVYSRIDPNRMGPGFVLEQGGQVLTTGVDSVTAERIAMATLPFAVGQHSYEVGAYSVREDPLAGRCFVGIAQPNADLLTQLGSGADSWALDLGTGEITNNGGVIDTIEAISERLWVGILADIANDQLRFYVSGSLKIVLDLDPGNMWVPAFSLKGPAADLRLAVNLGGQRAFNFSLLSVT